MLTIAPNLRDGETLVAATIAARAPVRPSALAIVLTSEGRVVSVHLDGTGETQVGVAHHMAEETGEREASQRIVVDGPYVVIVSELGLFGTVLSLDDPSYALALSREDYHASRCSYPIAFVTRDGRRCLVHGTAWNRLDVTVLESRELLTEREIDADKDLHHLDYFHASIEISPGGRTLVSNGWVWQPFDVRMTWVFDDFMGSYEPCGLALDGPMTSGYNWSRPLCFVDETHVAWGYNAQEDPGSNVGKDHGSELIIQSTVTGDVVERVPFDFFSTGGSPCGEVGGTVLFDGATKRFTTFGYDHDVVVTDRRGKELARSSERLHGACLAAGLGYRVDGRELHLVDLPT